MNRSWIAMNSSMINVISDCPEWPRRTSARIVVWRRISWEKKNGPIPSSLEVSDEHRGTIDLNHFLFLSRLQANQKPHTIFVSTKWHPHRSNCNSHHPSTVAVAHNVFSSKWSYTIETRRWTPRSSTNNCLSIPTNTQLRVSRSPSLLRSFLTAGSSHD